MSQLAIAFHETLGDRVYDVVHKSTSAGWTQSTMHLNRLLVPFVSFLSLYTGPSAAQSPSALVPYAQPSGLSDDITQWLSATSGSQIATCKSRMLANINIDGAAPGTVVASTSTENPNYHYNCK